MTKTNSLTKSCTDLLNASGFVVWRNNNGGVYDAKIGKYRKNRTHKQGVPDIIGYQKKTGKSFWCEIKTGTDKISPEQENFINEATYNNCFVIVVKKLSDCENFLKALNVATDYEIKALNL